MKNIFLRLYGPLVVLGILVRLAILIIPGNSVMTPWSGGGDMDAYVLLARNLVSGYGFSYAHVPSAWRTPGYPLVIAAAMELFGGYFAAAVRCLQVLLSILAAYFCMRAARIFFDEIAGKIALVAGLFFPTLLYFTGEFLSESLTAFCVAWFLWIFAEETVNPRWTTAAGMGVAIGLGALFRPNAAALGFLGVAVAWLTRRPGRKQLQVALVPLCAAALFVPWIARNYLVFGRFVLTTRTGTQALADTLNPEARILPEAEEREKELIGHVLPNELETNSPSRVALGSEIELDRKSRQAAQRLWREMGWGALARTTLKKWIAYWLSTDQLEPSGHSRRGRILHAGGVVFYWLLLALACAGWWKLRETHPQVAALLLGYAVLMTVLHIPFLMNTRIRSPLIDPLLAVLVGGGITLTAVPNVVDEERSAPGGLAGMG